MTERRVLLVVRLLLGALLIRQGAIGLSDLQHLAQTMEAHGAWQSWPLIEVVAATVSAGVWRIG